MSESIMVLGEYEAASKNVLTFFQIQNRKERNKRMKQATKKVATGLLVAGVVMLTAIGIMQMQKRNKWTTSSHLLTISSRTHL